MGKQLNGLQALRAFAAYAVVLYHVMRYFSVSNPLGLPLFATGAAGVDIFFVISGFIMVYVTPNHETALSFIARRLARIVPLYWFATVLAVILALARPWTFTNADISVESILASFMFIPAENLEGVLMPVLFVGWTLNFEMAFYVCFALSLLAPVRARPLLLSVMIVGGMLAAMAFGNGVITFYANTLVLEFLAGCAIAWFLLSETAKQIMPRVPVWPVALLGIAGFALTSEGVGDGLGRHILYGVPAALLVFAVASHDLYRKPFAKSLLQALGDRSYSAYLLHPIILSILAVFVFEYLGTGILGVSVMLIGGVGLTLLVSDITYKFLELPANKWLRACFGIAGPSTPVTARPD
ncbi:MAG: acyltransferase [Hyphomonas sp.]